MPGEAKTENSQAAEQAAEKAPRFETIDVLRVAGFVCGVLLFVAAILWARSREEGWGWGPGLLVLLAVALEGAVVGLTWPRIFLITWRELKGYFISPVAYAVMAFYFGVCGLIFYLILNQPGAKAEMRDQFGTMYFLLVFMVPILTMRLFSEERRSGTIELLMTSPVRDYEVVVGKYLAAVAFLVVMVIISLQYPIILRAYSNPDWGPIIAGYVGLLIAGAAFAAVGVFTSVLTKSQVAAAISAMLILLVFWLINWLGTHTSGFWSEVCRYLSIPENYEDFRKGIIDTRPIAYFVSLSILFLFMAVRALEISRIK